MDSLILQKLNNLSGQSLLLDELAIFFAVYLGIFLVVIPLILFLRDSKRYKIMIIEGFLSVMLARFGFVELIRIVFWQRLRPFFLNGDLNLLLNTPNEYSFPSGHAAFFFALSTTAYYYNKNLGRCFFVASALVAISRVFCGVHWPTDVIAGAAVGVFTSWLIHKFFHK